MNGQFDPRHGIKHVVVVGVGGTGSALARSIVRIIYDMDRRGLYTPHLTLIDPDVIEERNIGRQSALTPADVGKFKAMLLSKRLNLALGLDSTAIPEPFNPECHPNGWGTLLVGCVDNHQARRALSKAEGIWLDCGNHASDPSGQVICGNTADRDRVLHGIERMERQEGIIYDLPNAALLFPELLEPEPESIPDLALSCAERIEAGAQHLLINDMISATASAYIYRLLHRQPLNYFMSFISLEATRPIEISTENLMAYLPGG